MYFLKKNPAIQFTQAAAATIVESAKQSLADSSEGLTFDPVPHKYFFHGREMRSVSSIVEEYAPFDTVAKADRRCGDQDPRLWRSLLPVDAWKGR